MTDAQPPRPVRARLGEELKRLRLLAGVSQRDMAPATGLSQSTVFRVENGQSVPSWPEVRAWAERTAAADPDLDALRSLTERALNELTPFRVRLEDGLAAVQEDVRALEATARTLRNFNPAIVPGLLQTAAYARLVLGMAQAGDPATAVAIRMQRQQILYEPGRQFEFLLTEAALRWRPGAVSVLAGQLEHLAAVVTQDSVQFGVIPSGALMRAIPRMGFILYEDRADGEHPMVLAEMPHAPAYVSEEADVAVYRDQLALLRESAVWGDEAVAVVRGAAQARS
jgi:transcriptional regulator with XRE-family HTH domain